MYQVKSLSAPIPSAFRERTNLSYSFQVNGVDVAGQLLTKIGSKYLDSHIHLRSLQSDAPGTTALPFLAKK